MNHPKRARTSKVPSISRELLVPMPIVADAARCAHSLKIVAAASCSQCSYRGRVRRIRSVPMPRLSFRNPTWTAKGDEE